jgi:hypothetical protein
VPTDPQPDIGTKRGANNPAFSAAFPAAKRTAIQCSDEAALCAPVQPAFRAPLCTAIWKPHQPTLQFADSATVRIAK